MAIDQGKQPGASNFGHPGQIVFDLVRVIAEVADDFPWRYVLPASLPSVRAPGRLRMLPEIAAHQ